MTEHVQYMYSTDDVAKAAGTTEQAVRKAVSRKTLDMSDIGSVSRWVESRAGAQSWPQMLRWALSYVDERAKRDDARGKRAQQLAKTIRERLL